MESALVPEAEVKTILCAEVHAQIFTGSSLQNRNAVIHDRLSCGARPACAACVHQPLCFVWFGLARTNAAKRPTILG
jgi:hypothetical protein